MDDGTVKLGRVIGVRVKQERRWTLDRLAAAAGVSRMVVNVEQAEVNPSVGTLLRPMSPLRSSCIRPGRGCPAGVGHISCMLPELTACRSAFIVQFGKGHRRPVGT